MSNQRKVATAIPTTEQDPDDQEVSPLLPSAGIVIDATDDEEDIEIEERGPTPTGTIFSSSLNITNTILGSGMLAMVRIALEGITIISLA
jgi:hypothetical protein